MAYIEKEKVAEIRNLIKKEFKGFKFSVTRENYSTIDVRLMSSPLQLDNGLEFNHYHPDYCENEDFKKIYLRIFEIIRKVAPVEYHEIGDYGNQPNYYAYVKVGRLDKPYKFAGSL